LAARDGHVVTASRASIDMDGLRKKESNERDKLEVEYHDGRSDSRKELNSLWDNDETKWGLLFLRNWDIERLNFMRYQYGIFCEASWRTPNNQAYT
jgi:hypothetical protein